MTDKQKNLFDEVVPDEDLTVEVEEENESEENEPELSLDDLSSISPTQKKEIQLTKPNKEKFDVETTVTIENVTFTRPYLTNIDTGEEIPPTVSDSGAKYYSAKMSILFDKKTSTGQQLIEYYPNVKYFVNQRDGVDIISKVPLIPRTGPSVVAIIFGLVVDHMLKNKVKTTYEVDGEVKEKPVESEADVSDAMFAKYLIGKKVSLLASSGEYKGTKWFRNDLRKIL